MKWLILLIVFFLLPALPAIALENINIGVIDFSYEKDGQNSISRGFCATLEEKLRKLENLNVISRETQKPAFEELSITEPEKSLKEIIGKAICADFLLIITLKKTNKEIQSQLFDVNNNKILWEETFSEEKEDIFNIEGDIALKVAEYFKTPIPEKKKLYLIPANITSFKSFCEGLNLYEENSIAPAYSLFLASINEDPCFIDAYKYFEYTARKLNKIDDTIKKYENILETGEDNPVLINYLGNAYYYKKDLNKAENLYKKAIQLDDTFSIPHTNLGNIYVLNKKYTEALKEYGEALKFSDRKAQIYYNMGLLYYNRGDKDMAKTCFKKALDLEPRNPEFSFGRYYIFDMKVIVTARSEYVPGGVLGEVSVNLEPLFEIRVSSGNYSPLERAKIVSERLQHMIMEGLKVEDIKTGKVNNQVVIQNSSGDLIITITDDMALREGMTAEEMAKYKISLLKEFLQIDTSIMSLDIMITQGTKDGKIMKSSSKEADYLHKGDYYYGQGDRDMAKEAYKKALDINPGFAPAHFSLGIISFESKDYNNAENCFLNAIKNDSHYVDAYIWNGKLYIIEGKLSKAKSFLSKALELEPVNLEAKSLLNSI